MVSPIHMTQGKGVSTFLFHFEGANGQTKYGDSGKYGFPILVEPTSPRGLSTTVAKFGSTSLKCTGPAGSHSGYINTIKPLNVGTQEFSMECWAYFPSLALIEQSFMNMITVGGDIGLSFGVYGDGGGSGHIFCYFKPALSVQQFRGSSSFSISLNTWHHFAVSRVVNNLLFFFNGALISTVAMGGTPSLTTDKTELYFGESVNATTFYIDEFRFRLGNPAYTAAFTAPSAAFAG